MSSVLEAVCRAYLAEFQQLDQAAAELDAYTRRMLAIKDVVIAEIVLLE
jgi:hypothetical protein